MGAMINAHGRTIKQLYEWAVRSGSEDKPIIIRTVSRRARERTTAGPDATSFLMTREEFDLDSVILFGEV